MNIDEALQAIKSSPEYFVTFRQDTGEIWEVKNLTSEASAEDRMARLFAATSVPSGVPTVSRFLESASVTAESLNDLVEETRRAYESMTARVKIINGWRYQSLSELNPALIRRLLAVADSQHIDIPGEPSVGSLRLYLWRYEMKTTTFVQYW